MSWIIDSYAGSLSMLYVGSAIGGVGLITDLAQKARTLLDLHMTAWNLGMKTTYYVRSNDIDIAECEWCSS